MQPEDLEGLLTKIQSLQSIMVSVSTGGPRIQEKEEEYTELYLAIDLALEQLKQEGFRLSNPNPFKSLWDWYGYWSSNLAGYAARRQYVRELYARVVNPLQSALYKHRTEASSVNALVKDVWQRLQQTTEERAPTFHIRFESLHTKIVQRCRTAFETGQYDDAIFNAMKTVEEEIRARIAASPTDLGVGLISKAMNPKSPRLIFSTVEAEQEAAHALYRRAIGSFKNPLSHRFLDTNDPIKTFEILAFSSLLMRMLDSASNKS